MKILDDFETYLTEQDRATLTIRGYLTDLRQFVRWFEQTNGQSFTIEAVTPTDVREHR